jgi:hypothetical protein
MQIRLVLVIMSALVILESPARTDAAWPASYDRGELYWDAGLWYMGSHNGRLSVLE